MKCGDCKFFRSRTAAFGDCTIELPPWVKGRKTIVYGEKRDDREVWDYNGCDIGQPKDA